MSAKIYFCGSVTGGRQDKELYASLISHLKTHGQVLTDFLGNDKHLAEAEKGKTETDIHDVQVEWLKQCDVVVAETTQTSLGVGYEVGRAMEMKKNILCLFRPGNNKKLSPMISGAPGNNSNIVVRLYNTEDEAGQIFKEFFEGITK